MKILYVEDNPADADLTRRELTRHDPGARVDVAGTLAEARSRLRHGGGFDLVLSDVGLPDGSGLELLSEIRERRLPVAVVVLTGTGDVDTVVAALRAGADDYQIKGAEGRQLSLTLGSALIRFRARAAGASGGLHLMYAEPNPVAAEATRRHLEKHAPHIRLDVVATADELLRRFRRPAGQPGPCDVLLLECRLEGEASLDALKALLDEGRLHVPVVMLGQEGDEQLATHALRLGADVHYLVKHPNYFYALPATLENAHRGALLDRERAALRESQARLAGLIETARDAIVSADAAHRVVLFNPAAERMFRCSVEDALGQPLERFIPDRFRAGHSARVEAFAETGGPGGYLPATLGLRSDGEEFPIEASISKTRVGEQDLFTVILRDITERTRAEEDLRRSEERFRSYVESAPVGVLAADREGRIVDANPAAIRMLGYDAAAVAGMPFLDLHPEADREERRGDVARLMREGRFAAEVRMRRRDGAPIWVSLHATVAADGWSLVYCQDVTERRRSEEQRRHLEAQLHQALKMEAVGRLAGGVAHDFNNMLNVILGHADLALRRLGHVDATRKNLEEVRSAAQRSAELTRQLLAFSRRQTIAPRVLDLNAQMRGIEKLLRRIIGEDVDLEFRLGEGLWPVSMDPSQVDQVLANLAINARDALPEGGKLTVETSNETLDEAYCRTNADALPGEYVLLAVSDDGCGMDPQTVERAFEPFFTTKPEGKGTGLGLAMVYGVAHQNQGSVRIYSEVGRGTTVRLYLPRHPGVETPGPAAAPAAAPERGTETILLVEDEDPLRELARDILEDLGYRVIAAASPGEAISSCAKHTGVIDLLLTDVVMPMMNGKELSERIRALRPDIKVLFTSGYTANAIAHHGVLEPGVDFLEKPYSLAAIAQKVRAVLAGGVARPD